MTSWASVSANRAVAGFRKEQVASAAAKVEASRQAAILAQRQLEKATLKTPFKGRIERENWIEQARILASGGQTEFSRRVDRGDA